MPSKAGESGWRILCRRPVAARLLVVVFFYMPLKMGLAPYVRPRLGVIVFGLGGLVWVPFTPVAHSFLRSCVEAEEQQVVTLWTAGSTPTARAADRAGREHRRADALRCSRSCRRSRSRITMDRSCADVEDL